YMYTIHQRQPTPLPDIAIFLVKYRLIELQLDDADVVELEALGCKALQRVDIYPVLEGVDGRGDDLGCKFHEVRAAGENGGLAEPNERRVELIGRLRRRLHVNEDITPAHLNFIRQRDR